MSRDAQPARAGALQFILNDRPVTTPRPSGYPVLDLLRRDLQLTGTKEACREGDCGACAVLLGTPSASGLAYRSVPSCLLPTGELAGRHLVTIEAFAGEALTPLQEAIVREGASQCGFCTPGIVVSATGFLLNSATLSREDAQAALEGHICRCTGYRSILRAVLAVADEVRPRVVGAPDRIGALVRERLLPAWFPEIPERLAALAAAGPGPADPGIPVVAGGTDLYVQQPAALRAAQVTLLLREGGDRRIRQEQGQVVIGAAVTVQHLLESRLFRELLPGLAGPLRLISSQLIRNRATLTGNIVNASPIGDLTILMLALGAELGLAPAGKAGGVPRVVALRDFYRGYKQIDLRPGERIDWIRFPAPGSGTRVHFEKVARRTHLDIASVNCAARLELDRDGRITAAAFAAGGVAPIPLLLAEASSVARGQRPTSELVRATVAAADREIRPISDVRGSVTYKRLLLRQLLWAHFLTLLPEAELEEALS